MAAEGGFDGASGPRGSRKIAPRRFVGERVAISRKASKHILQRKWRRVRGRAKEGTRQGKAEKMGGGHATRFLGFLTPFLTSFLLLLSL